MSQRLHTYAGEWCVRMLRSSLARAAVFLLILSIGMGAVAHAAEGLESTGHKAKPTMMWHVDGDAEHTPPDSDGAVPHLHAGCHGHHAGALLQQILLPTACAVMLDPVSQPAKFMSPVEAMPDIKPPIS